VELDRLWSEGVPPRAAPPEVLLDLADFASGYKDRPAEATRLYALAFEAQPALADTSPGMPRYRAARAALRAANGRSDAPTADAKDEPAHLRSQALAWLHAEVGAMKRQVAVDADGPGRVTDTVQRWRSDPDLEGVRDPSRLAGLPEAERSAWGAFWEDVSRMRSPPVGR
jgi:hypothetical protein